MSVRSRAGPAGSQSRSSSVHGTGRLAKLPELLLKVHSWTGFLDADTHLAGTASRASDLPVSAAALLVAEACNISLTPVTKAGDRP